MASNDRTGPHASASPAGLVRPLEEPWRDVLDRVLSSVAGSLRIADVARLAPRLAELSRVYNEAAVGAKAGAKAPLDARIAFSFARDVPKGAAAVRELVAAGLLRVPADRPFRILDLGAGLGAMTWGVARAMTSFTGAGAGASSSAVPRIESLLVDADPEVLDAARKIATEASRARLVPNVDVAVETRTSRLGAEKTPWPVSDLVIVGQTLSELDVDVAPEVRVERHVALVRDLLDDAVREDGALVIVEPALRVRSRHLHAVRDRLVASGAATIFAPCLHAQPCPAYALDGEWCHDDLAVDLPPWLVPLARGAGLRFQGLTFSYLVLRKDGRSLRACVSETASPKAVHLRVISDLLRTKGKTELFACTAEGRRERLRRLDRDEPSLPSALTRGSVVTLLTEPTEPDSEASPPIDVKGRIGPRVRIDVWPTKN